MAKKKLFGFIETDPRILFHYLPLVGVVFLAHWTSVNPLFNLESLTQTNPILGWSLLTAWYYLWLNVGDNFIHTFVIHKS
jgi:hypothetical protein